MTVSEINSPTFSHTKWSIAPHICSLSSITTSLCLVRDRAVASVLQGGCPGEQFRGEEGLGMHSQHFVSRTPNLREWCFFSLCAKDFWTTRLLWKVFGPESSGWKCGCGLKVGCNKAMAVCAGWWQKKGMNWAGDIQTSYSPTDIVSCFEML